MANITETQPTKTKFRNQLNQIKYTLNAQIDIFLHEIFSSGVIPDNNAKDERNSKESTRLFYITKQMSISN
jgi:hypothetical protein